MKAIALEQPATPMGSIVARVLAITAFTLATAAAAQVRIPVPGSPVPITLQTAIVLLAGMRLGARDGALSQVLYLVCGAVGLPFFAGSAGLAELIGPTGGYLFGFVLVAWAAGRMTRTFGAAPGSTFFRNWFVAFAASLLVFVPGLLQLKLFMHLSLRETFAMGFLPYLIGDAVKVTCAAVAQSSVRRYFL